MASPHDRNPWTAGVLLAVLSALLVLAWRDTAGRLPELRPLPRTARGTSEVATALRTLELFQPEALAPRTLVTNRPDPFATLHFQPPPPPPKRPVDITYQGSYQTSGGELKAFLLVGGATFVRTPGMSVTGDLAVASVTVRQLTLTNTAGATNVLDFNVKKTLEIPAK